MFKSLKINSLFPKLKRKVIFGKKLIIKFFVVTQIFRLNDQLLEDGTTTLEEWLEDPANDIRYVLVNGQLQPQKQINTGKIYRFR